MNSEKPAAIVWLKTAFFGTLILLVALLLISIKVDDLFFLSVLFLSFSSIFHFWLALVWSLPQFVLTILTLEQIYKMNISVKQKIYWTTLATFIYSILTAASFNYPSSFLLFFFWTNTDIFTTILFLSPYIGVSVIIMYYEATIFYNQDKIP